MPCEQPPPDYETDEEFDDAVSPAPHVVRLCPVCYERLADCECPAQATTTHWEE